MTVEGGLKTFGAMKTMFNVRSVYSGANMEFYESELVPTVTYGSEPWGMSLDERLTLDAIKNYMCMEYEWSVGDG